MSIATVKHTLKRFDVGRWNWQTSGFRATRSKTGFTRKTVGVLSQVVVEIAKRQMTALSSGIDHRFFVSYDTREGSRDIAYLIANIARANGLDVNLSTGHASSPEFSRYVLEQCKTDPKPIIRGIIVTGSHLRSIDNGVCPVMSDGSVISSEATTEVIDILNSETRDLFYLSPKNHKPVPRANMQLASSTKKRNT